VLDDARRRYTIIAIMLHWLIALAIVFMLWLGWNMDQNEARYQLHKSLGITILVLTIARTGWRLLNPPPALPAGLSNIEQLASRTVHIAFYALLLLMPLSGWLLVSTSYDFDVPTVLYGTLVWPDLPFVGGLTNEAGHSAVKTAHESMSKLMVFLLVLHIGGALKHQLSAESGIIHRMIPDFSKTAIAASQPARGRIIVPAATGVLFAAIVLLPQISGNFRSGAHQSGDRPVSTDSNWALDKTASFIKFSGQHDGETYTGQFNDWYADIVFDLDRPQSGIARVTVNTASVETNKTMYTTTLAAPEWFNSAANPEARITIMDISLAGNAYRATAKIEIKDRELDVPFEFSITMDGDIANVTGQTVLSRQPFDLGQTSDPDGDWVDEDVSVDVFVRASRTR